MTVRVEIPMALPSVANLREHWATKAKRVKAQRNAVRLAMTWRRRVPLPVVVTLTRIGLRRLDSDNLQGAFKAVRDQVAAQLEVDDADPRVTWCYQQEKGRSGVRIELEERLVGVVDPGPEAVAE